MKFHKLYIAAVATIWVAISWPSHSATTLLPNGKQCFTTSSGVAAASGSLNMYVPATTTPKTTWQDANQTTQNSQPIQLDAQGCAIIYGIGQYRQQLYDGPVVGGNTSGNLIWDQLTTDTSAFNSVFWAGIAGNSPNVITIVDPGFNATDGSVINFTVLATNTGSVTINPSSFGAITVFKDTTGGPVVLSGGELVQNNIASVVYRASDNAFHLVNPPIQTATGGTEPLCGATNLKITNNAATPNSVIDITADQAVMQSAAGLVINRSTVSVSVNTSTGTVTSAANGMDGEAVGTSAWLDLFLIDNGSAVASLASLAAGNGKSPTLPSGYTYKCYIGAMRVDSAGVLKRTMQLGNIAQYVITTSTNTAIPPTIANGVSGTFSTTNPVLASVTISSTVPPTATGIYVAATNNARGAGVSNVLVAPNTSWGGNNQGPNGTNSVSWPIFFASGVNTSMNAYLLLESASTIAWTADGAGGQLSTLGWRDGVNAP